MNEETSNYQKYNSKNKVKQIMIKRFQEKLLKLLENENKNTSILDAGCGEGFIADYIYNNTKIKNITGIDINKDSLDFASSINKKIKYKKDDIYKLSFKDKQFDIVMTLEVLEHLDNPKKALKEIIRVAKKKLIISVPNEPYFSLGNLLSLKNVCRLGNPPDHINRWSKNKFERFINNEINNKYKTTVFTSFPWTIIVIEK